MEATFGETPKQGYYKTFWKYKINLAINMQRLLIKSSTEITQQYNKLCTKKHKITVQIFIIIFTCTSFVLVTGEFYLMNLIIVIKKIKFWFVNCLTSVKSERN